MHLLNHLVRVSTIALLLACNGPTDDCAGVGVDGLRMVIRDARTNADVATLATVTVSQLSAPFLSRTGKLTDPPPTPLDVGAGRPGSYRITVEASGYLTWTEQVEVRATGQPCSQPITTNVVALLEPTN